MKRTEPFGWSVCACCHEQYNDAQSHVCAYGRLASSPRSEERTVETSRVARPFVKWAGGKTRILPALRALAPSTFGTYYEPFVGGGALFYSLGATRACLSDNNLDLINAYSVVQNDAEQLIAALGQHRYEEGLFLAVRALDPSKLSLVERAARFVFLNRTCFNGLYRVNSRGQFNVSFGKYKAPLVCDAANLRACSLALRGVKIRHEPFEHVLDRAVAGDFVYFDPPYLPISATSSFTSYTSDGFGLADHQRLCAVAVTLKKRGAHVLISNSAAPAIRDLYRDGFEIKPVSATRVINSKADGRGPITELIIR